jgi:hypothetical protein
VSRVFKRIADRGGPGRGQALIDVRRYPALLLLYGIGLAGLSQGNYQLLNRLLHLDIRNNRHDPEAPVAKLLHTSAVMVPSLQNLYFPESRTGLSDHLFAVLRDPLWEYVPDDIEYEQTFDWFEYLLCLVYCDVQNTRAQLQEKKKKPNFGLKAPIGRFAWKGGRIYDIVQETQIREDQPFPLSKKVAAVLQAGFFESAGGPQNFDKFRDIKAGFDTYLEHIRLGR